MFFGKDKLIGLDIGSSSIKMAELSSSRKGVTLSSFASIPTPEGGMSEGSIVETESIAGAIAALKSEIQTKRRQVATSISGSSVIIKKISVPKMDEATLSEQLRWEAEQYIPYDVNEVHLGFHILNSFSDAESMQVLLIAAIQENVFRYAESIELAQLSCSVVDVSGLSVANCFLANYGKSVEDLVALINIGACSTNLVILERQEVVFSRDLPVGGQVYTNEIQKVMSVSEKEAEALKVSACSGEGVPEEVLQTLNNTHDLVLEELGAGIDFFLNTSGASKLEKSWVTGGGSRTLGLMERMSDLVPCEKMDPFLSLKYSSKVFDAGYIDRIRDFAANVIGLGLRKVDDH